MMTRNPDPHDGSKSTLQLLETLTAATGMAVAECTATGEIRELVFAGGKAAHAKAAGAAAGVAGLHGSALCNGVLLKRKSHQLTLLLFCRQNSCPCNSSWRSCSCRRATASKTQNKAQPDTRWVLDDSRPSAGRKAANTPATGGVAGSAGLQLPESAAAAPGLHPPQRR